MAKLAFLIGMIALTLTVPAVGQLPPSSYKYTPGTFPNPDATYFIETSIPGQCAALQDAGTGDGIPVVLRRCRNAPEFRFKFEPWIQDGYYFGGEYKIRTANGKCLHVQDGPPTATPPLPGGQSWRKGLWQADCQDTQPFMFTFRDAGTSAEALGYKRIETMYSTCYHVREHPPGGNELWTWRCSPESRNEPAFWFRFTTSPPAGRPIPPPRVKVFGDWPQAPFFCQFALPPAGRYVVPDEWRDRPSGEHYQCPYQVSGVEVPFGSSLQICRGGTGLDKCRTYLPGRHYVGDDMNDLMSVMYVNPDMVGFLYSADFPTEIKPGIQFGMTGHNGRSGSVTISYDETDIVQENSIPLPATCPKPQVIETERTKQARWAKEIRGGRLHLQLRVPPSAPDGPHHWVRIRIVCS